VAALPALSGVTTVAAIPPVFPPLPEVRMPETPQLDADVVEAAPAEGALVEESLVEEVSIDGMCGVY
jgi:mycofactocin precursor